MVFDVPSAGLIPSHVTNAVRAVPIRVVEESVRSHDLRMRRTRYVGGVWSARRGLAPIWLESRSLREVREARLASDSSLR